MCTTNPTLGRGLSLALWGAIDLVETIQEYGEDLVARALALDRRVAEHILPFFEDQAAIDSARLATLRHNIFGAPAPEPNPSRERVSFAQLRAAALFDPVAFRALWTVFWMLRLPNEVYTDPRVVRATFDVLDHLQDTAPAVQPTNAQLCAALATGLLREPAG